MESTSSTKHVPTTPLNSFVQFGCWNNLNEKVKENGTLKTLGCLKSVMALLNEYLKSNTTDAILVSGDNYYPAKQKGEGETKKKKILSGKLLEGFNLLPTKPKIYMILGNHDLETNTNLDDSKNSLFMIDEEKKEIKETVNSCTILHDELQNTDNKSLHDITYDIYQELPVTNGMLIMIDTSMYEKDEKVEEYLSCYQAMYKKQGKPIPETIAELREKQRNAISASFQNYMSETLNYVILVGHHPILQNRLKEKKEKEKEKEKKKKKEKEKEKEITGIEPAPSEQKEDNMPPPPLPINSTIGGAGGGDSGTFIKKQSSDILSKFMSVLKQIYTLSSNKNKKVKFYYLCSDLHLYQTGVIQLEMDNNEMMEIDQYIVGTGGTELDPAYNSKDTMETAIPEPTADPEINGTYRMTLDTAQCGFLTCTLTGTQPSFVPIFVEEKGKVKNKKIGGRRATKSRKIIKSKPKSKKHSKYRKRFTPKIRKNKSTKRFV